MDLREAVRLHPDLPPYTTCARWVKRGLVEAKGGGRQRVLWEISDKQIHELRTLARLRGLLSMQALVRAAKTLRRMGFNPYSSGSFAVVEDGELIRIGHTAEGATAVTALLKRPGQCVLVSLSALAETEEVTTG